MTEEQTSPTPTWWSKNQGYVVLALILTVVFTVFYVAHVKSTHIGKTQWRDYLPISNRGRRDAYLKAYVYTEGRKTEQKMTNLQQTSMKK